MTTRPLAAPAMVSDQAERSPISLEGKGQRRQRLTLLGFIIMFIGVAIGVIGKMLMHDDMVTLVGVLISLVGMFLTAYPYLSPSFRQKHTSAPQPEVLTRSQPTMYLPRQSSIEYVPSITERTTDLLNSPAPTRTQEKEDGEPKA